jgi:hypothetical protein
MSKFFDKWLSGPPQRNGKPSDDTLPSEHAATPGRAVSGEMLEAEIMRVVPMLCNKAEASPELKPEISGLIDIFFEFERAGNDAMLLESLKQAEARYAGK